MSLQTKVDNKFLFEYLNELSAQYERKEPAADIASIKVKSTLQKFVQSGAEMAGK